MEAYIQVCVGLTLLPLSPQDQSGDPSREVWGPKQRGVGTWGERDPYLLAIL